MKWFGVFHTEAKAENLVECRETEFQAKFWRNHFAETEAHLLKPRVFIVVPVEVKPINA